MRARVSAVVALAASLAAALSSSGQVASAPGQTTAAQGRRTTENAPPAEQARLADSIARYTLIKARLDTLLQQRARDTTQAGRTAATQTRDSLARVDSVLAAFQQQARQLPPGPAPAPAVAHVGAGWKEIALTLLCLALYFFALVAARWHHIARSLHVMIDGQLAALSTRLATEVGGDDPPPHGLKHLRATVAELKEQEKESRKTRPFEFFFWSRGRENATWVTIHEVERQLAAFLAPPEHVDVYLHWAVAHLRTLDKPDAYAIADAIRASLDSPARDDGPLGVAQLNARKALLGRALSIIYADRDMRFSTLMEWQNKASWLILFALILIGFLTVAVGHSVLFLAGAAGGYVSRLMRALRREDVPLDYGASWTTLFLSPLFGALAGWFGVALIALAASPRANLLGPAFQLVDWADPTKPETLAVAFLLGFSERFFDAVVRAVEKNAEREETQPRGAGRASTPAATAPQVDAPSGNGKGPAPAGAVPAVAGAERVLRAAGAEKDALLVKGSGFAAGAKATVNDEARLVEVQSAQKLVLPLSEEDIKRIDAGGDFEIVIANPGGAASKPYDFA